MCVIIHKPKGKSFDKDDLLTAYDNNQDGFGFMYYDEDKDKIIAKKGTTWEGEDIAKFITSDKMKDKEAVFHYRYKTKGEIINQQCHPFKVLDKKRDGMEMYFMHNGTISGVDILDKESDTQAFCRDILKPILKKNPSLIKEKAFQVLIEKYISTGSKLCFMFGKGEVVKFNEEQGDTRHDCWVSNTYSFRNSYRSNTGKKWGSTHTTTKNSQTTGGTTGTKNTTSSQQTGKTTNFLGKDVKVGDGIWIVNTNSQNWIQEGRITVINGGTLCIRFKDRNNLYKTKTFWLEDGACLNVTTEPYYAFPEYVQSSTDNSTKVKDVLPKQKKDEKESNLVLIEDARKEKEAKEEAKEEDKESLEAFIEHGGLQIDPYDCYGGAFEDGYIYSYGDREIEIEDVYDMSSEERLAFFMDDVQASFNMFQDLVEYFVDQDTLFVEQEQQKHEERVVN